MDAMLSNFGWGSYDALRFSGTDIFTAAEIDAQNAKPKQQRQKAVWELEDAFGDLTNQALSSARSLDELDDSLLQMIGNLGNQLAQNSIPGIGGDLAGGAFQFLTNLLSLDDDKLPVRDGALDVRLVEITDNSRDITARRDSGQLVYDARRRGNFDSLAMGA